jgi:hypothetical protein
MPSCSGRSSRPGLDHLERVRRDHGIPPEANAVVALVKSIVERTLEPDHIPQVVMSPWLRGDH